LPPDEPTNEKGPELLRTTTKCPMR
jgi:hypothetical protein